MKHVFDVEIAEKYGVHAAVLLEMMNYWISNNEANMTNFHDGKTWTYNSISALAKQFSYFTERQIRTALDKLVESGLLVKGNYNKNPYDRTLWYALTDCGYSILQNSQIHLTKKSNVSDEKVKPIPVNNPISIPNKKTPIVPNGFDAFWKAYPRKIAKPKAQAAWLKIKPTPETIDLILAAVAAYKRTEQWGRDDGNFIPHPATWLNQHRWEDEIEPAVREYDPECRPFPSDDVLFGEPPSIESVLAQFS